jgi:molecular chaperone DnaJ
MSKKDYYELLGTEKGASESEIKKAYRKKAMQYHPDKVGNGTDKEKVEAEKKFKEINEAYQVLSDSTKKQQYDQYGHAAFEQGGGGGGNYRSGGFGGEDLGDIFGSFFGGGFGGGNRRRGPEPGEDLSYQVEITLEEAAHGVEKTVKYKREGQCGTCHGTGGKPESKTTKCSKCNGKGKIKKIQRTMFGNIESEEVCGTCHGTGKIYEEKCSTCHGRRIVNEAVEKTIKIPAGIESGQKLRISGMGEASRDGGENGDLYIFIKVKPHAFFERDGSDIYCRVPISYYIATSGGEIEVPTLNGKKSIKITPGTQTGKRLNMKGEGIINLRGKWVGSQIVEVYVEVPVDLSGKQLELLKSFDDSLKDKNYKAKRTFTDKLKKILKM